LLPQPVVIDCIEFSSDLRRLDILDELAFLSMECDAGGYPHVGEQIVQRYREVTGDPGPVSLLAFYKSYRACVRAKVCALRAIQESGTAHATAMAQALKYLKISQREQLLMIPQRLIVVSGLMGTGKSSLARDVAERLDATLLQTDELRRQKFGASPAGAQYGEGFYRPSLREEVYEALFEQADRLLARGHSVVLDGTFAAARHRHAAQRLAERRRAEFLLVRCQCPRHAAIERIERRRRSGPTTSEARGELFDQQAAEWESDTDGMARPLVMDTQRPLAQQAEQVVHRLEAGE
jgi:predicted kinase